MPATATSTETRRTQLRQELQAGLCGLITALALLAGPCIELAHRHLDIRLHALALTPSALQTLIRMEAYSALVLFLGTLIGWFATTSPRPRACWRAVCLASAFCCLVMLFWPAQVRY